MISNLRQRLLTTSVLIGAAAFMTTPAWAQSTDQDTQEPPVQVTPDQTQNSEMQADQARDDETIVVTGSRIQRRDLTSAAPLTVVQDEEFQLSGATNVEQVMNTLPQAVAGSTGFNNNPGGGVATLNLRGLGASRTKVLVNGRGWMFYDVGQGVDLNTIPTFLIDSVDVVTGGASAVYGSDAIAGVVNFRLQTDLQGIIAGTHYGITGRGDGPRYGAHFAVGSGMDDGRGHVTAYAEYYNRGDVFQGDRDFARFSTSQASGIDVCVNPALVNPRYGIAVDPATGRTPTGAIVGNIIQTGANAGGCASGVPGFAAAGSSTVEYGALRDLLGVTGGALRPGFVFLTPGVASPRVASRDQYNYAPANFLMVPQQRWLLGAYGEYEISDAAKVFTEISFVNNRVQNELAATPVTGFFNIDVNQACGFVDAATCQRFRNAGAAGGDPDVIEDIFVQRRVLETGPRNQLDERNAFRALAGLRGEVTDWLNYEGYYFYARTRNSQRQTGNISVSRFTAGLDGTGTPINIFGPNTLDDEMVEAITVPASNSDVSNLQVGSLAFNGTLGNLGFGAEDIGFAFGGEYRKVSSAYEPDFSLASGDVIGFNAGEPTAGGYNVRELFGELRIPIVADRPFLDVVELWGAGRYSDYSLPAVGGVWTYAAGGEFGPVPDIRFRGQYQRAVRAPNVANLFGGQSVGFPPATDPCGQPYAATDPAVRATCIATGVPAARVGDPTLQLNSQIEGLFGGNPNLEEETADTWTIGAVISPRFVPRLNIAIDYYDITVKDAIGTFGGGVNNILDLCYNVIQDANDPYCQAINRNIGGVISGDEFVVEALSANVAKLTARGVDFQVDYNLPVGFSLTGSGSSRLNFFFLGNRTLEADLTAVQELPEDIDHCAGKFGILACGEPTPKWKWSSRLAWVDGPVTVTGRWRHIGSVKDDDNSTFYTVEKIPAANYFDAAVSFDIADRMQLTAGVNNLLDKEPELLGVNQEQANTWPNTYEVLGRDFFVSANLRF